MLYDLNEKENRIYEFICDYMKEKGRGYIIRKNECPRAIKVV